ncbi:MAG: hypothetical protein ACQEP1_04505 [Nanobdellota archaeon]
MVSYKFENTPVYELEALNKLDYALWNDNWGFNINRDRSYNKGLINEAYKKTPDHMMDKFYEIVKKHHDMNRNRINKEGKPDITRRKRSEDMQESL